MAFRFNEDAYYGDMTPGYVPNPHPSPDRPDCPSGEVTEIDFDKVTVLNEPWVDRRDMSAAMDGVSSDKPETAGEANDRLDDMVRGLKECVSANR